MHYKFLYFFVFLIVLFYECLDDGSNTSFYTDYDKSGGHAGRSQRKGKEVLIGNCNLKHIGT